MVLLNKNWCAPVHVCVGACSLGGTSQTKDCSLSYRVRFVRVSQKENLTHENFYCWLKTKHEVYQLYGIQHGDTHMVKSTNVKTTN